MRVYELTKLFIGAGQETTDFEHAHCRVLMLTTGSNPQFFAELKDFLVSGLLKPRQRSGGSSSKVRLATLSVFPCIMGCNIIPVIHLTDFPAAAETQTVDPGLFVCQSHFPSLFANSC